MDTSEYLGMFLAESREHLQTLNLAVIRIEECPDDGDTIDEIFRIAHSLKGMSGTMGFAQMAALTHKMEDVFETLRGRSQALERRVIDVLLECLDAIEAAVASIESEGSENLDPSDLIARLGALVGEAAATTAPVAPGAESDMDDQVFAIVVTLSDDVMMPAVRAFMTLAVIADHGEVVRAEPTTEQVDDFNGRTIRAWVASEHEPATIEAAVMGVPEVTTVEITIDTAAPPSPPPPQPTGTEPTEGEPRPAAPPAARKSAGTVRVDADRLDQLMHHMGELVVHRTRMESLVASAEIDGLSAAVQDLTRSSQALQAMVMQVRMIEVDAVFMRFPRLVRDLSSKLSKQVELVLTGRDTELDRTVVDALGDPIVHLVRNSLDHALEGPEERLAAGKPPTGRLELSARHASGNVIITVRDDGRGLDPSRVAQKAFERGLISADAVAGVDMARAIELVFAAGFSTAETTSDISGRGVGMDAVRTAIRELGGALVMTSEQGQGTTVQIRLPLTLAIMPALLIEAGGVPFAIPLERVERTLSLAHQTVRSITGSRTLVLDDGVLPLLDLATRLGYQHDVESGFVVIARGGQRRLALAVDRLIGQRELVTRPLPAELGNVTALSGGAVLSDGTIALIVDCDAIADTVGRATAASDLIPT